MATRRTTHYVPRPMSFDASDVEILTELVLRGIVPRELGGLSPTKNDLDQLSATTLTLPYLLQRSIEAGNVAAPERPFATTSQVEAFTTPGLFEWLARLRIDADAERFVEASQTTRSAWKLSRKHWLSQPFKGRSLSDRDAVGLIAVELWRRLRPELPSAEAIAERVFEFSLLGATVGAYRKYDLGQLRNSVDAAVTLIPPEYPDTTATEDFFGGPSPVANLGEAMRRWFTQRAQAADRSSGADLFARLIARFPGDAHAKDWRDTERMLRLGALGPRATDADIDAFLAEAPEDRARYIFLCDALAGAGDPEGQRRADALFARSISVLGDGMLGSAQIAQMFGALRRDDDPGVH